MGTFIVSAKFLKTKEEDMELRDERDLGNIGQLNRKWVYKRQGLDANDIFRVVEFTFSKTLLETYEGKEILCNEPFDDVYKKWSEACEISPEMDDTETEINQGDENDSEEDDD